MDITLITVKGRVAKEPKGFGNGHAAITVASNWKRGDREGTNWLNVVCFGYDNWPEWKRNFVQKGQDVLITGALRVEDYENKDGEKRQSLSVTLDQIIPAGKRGQGGGADGVEAPGRISDQDIPF